METLDAVMVEQAAQSAGDTRDTLRDALKGATAIEAIVLLVLIEHAALLERDIKAMIAARAADARAVR